LSCTFTVVASGNISLIVFVAGDQDDAEKESASLRDTIAKKTAASAKYDCHTHALSFA
jgi:hypothetical protein